MAGATATKAKKGGAKKAGKGKAKKGHGIKILNDAGPADLVERNGKAIDLGEAIDGPRTAHVDTVQESGRGEADGEYVGTDAEDEGPSSAEITRRAGGPLPPAMSDGSGVLLDLVDASPLNPRKHFDQAKLEGLADSIRVHGVLEPIVVRPKGAGRYEIVAGERRWRATKLAGLTHIPVRVLEISDEDLVELMMVENLQRDDLTPLEEARGYRALIDTSPTKFTAEAIAAKIGKSAKYVWDSMKLLDLVKIGQELLDRGKISKGHAIVIARLKPEQQEKLLDANNIGREGGLWMEESTHGLFTEEEEDERYKQEQKDPYLTLKTRSVRELEAHVAGHVRFDPAHAAKADPFLFEGTKAAVDAAKAEAGRGAKVLAITHEYRVSDDARDESERTYGVNSWERADGLKGSKTCDHSVLGLVVAGPEQGHAFLVCVNKDKCKVHYKARVEAKEKAERARQKNLEAAAKGKHPGDVQKAAAAQKKAETEWQRQERKDREEREREAKQQKAFEAITPRLLESCAAAVKKAPVATLIAEVLKLFHADKWKWEKDAAKAAELVGAPKDAEGTLRCIVMEGLVEASGAYRAFQDFTRTAGPFGGGLGAILKEAAKPEQKPAAAAKGAKAGKGKGAGAKPAKRGKGKKDKKAGGGK